MNDLVQEGKNLHTKMKRKAVTITASSTGNPIVESLCMDHSLWSGKVRKQYEFEKLPIPFALFDDLYEDYRDFGVLDSERLRRGLTRLAQQIEYLEKQENSDSGESAFYRFQLHESGLLSRRAGTKIEKYAIKRDSFRYRIIVELSGSGSKTYHTSKKLAEALNTTDKQVQRSIADVRKQIQKKFKGMKGEDFIEIGSSNLGYRLGSRVRIAID